MKNYSNIRKQDIKDEKEFLFYLQQHFYPKYTTNFKVMRNTELQMLGIDTMFIFNGERILCDEKAAISYTNKFLNTFAFEIDFNDITGRRCNGWFINKQIITTHYLLCYINRCDKVETGFFAKNIRDVDVILVSREKLHDYLENTCGLSMEDMVKGAKELFLERKKLKGYKVGEPSIKERRIGNLKTDGYQIMLINPKYKESSSVIKIPKKEIIKISELYVNLKT